MFRMCGGRGMPDVGERYVQQHPHVRVGEAVVGHPPRPAYMDDPVRA